MRELREIIKTAKLFVSLAERIVPEQGEPLRRKVVIDNCSQCPHFSPALPPKCLKTGAVGSCDTLFKGCDLEVAAGCPVDATANN